MANYSTLKAAVADVVKTNGTQAITGANLQAVLLSIINSVGGGGYIFKGVATPSTDAGTPDENVFYIGGAGTYANFGTSVTVPVGSICVFKYNGSWTCEQVTVENGGVFDISAFNAVGGTLATYADLEAALGNNGANVPEGIRKGGMSIKFVQSSDNKYVQYRLVSDEWSADTDDWAVAEEGIYVGNAEYIYVKADSQDRILWAIKADGSIFYGAGVPQQIVDYINTKIAEYHGDDIVAFLNGLEEEDKTLQQLFDEKVDKAEGKSLINSDYASTKSSINNPEYIQVTTDSDGRILEGRKRDGTVVENCDVEYPNGIPSGIKRYVDESVNIEDEVSISYVSNNQYLITFGKYTILLFRTISIENDQDNWNIGTIKRGDNVICPTGTDIIGPIKVSGDSDFLSGVHGSSTTTILNVCCDGEQLTLDSSLNVSGSIITIQMLDECRRTTDQSHVFDRYVTITITSNRIKISNTFKCVVEGITVETATNGGLFAIQNNHYNSLSLNNCIYTTPPSLSIDNTSKNNISAVFNTNNGSVTVHNIKGHELSTYRGQAVVFTSENPMRTKIYFYLMLNRAVSNGEEISGEFEYVFS